MYIVKSTKELPTSSYYCSIEKLLKSLSTSIEVGNAFVDFEHIELDNGFVEFNSFVQTPQWFVMHSEVDKRTVDFTMSELSNGFTEFSVDFVQSLC